MERKSLNDIKEFNEERFTKRVMFQKDGSVAFALHFLPGQALPTHKHPGSALYLLVVEGAGTVTIDGSKTEVAAEDVVYCQGEEEFSFANTSSAPTRLYAVLTKLPDEKYAKDV